jgi:hypothetical protein
MQVKTTGARRASICAVCLFGLRTTRSRIRLLSFDGRAHPRRHPSYEHDIGEAATHISKKRDVDLRIYPCGFCGGFHFTHKSLEQVVLGQEAA